MITKTGFQGRSVSIIGVGSTPIGMVNVHEEMRDRTEGELLASAVIDALEDPNLDATQIDYSIVGALAPQYSFNMAIRAPCSPTT